MILKTKLIIALLVVGATSARADLVQDTLIPDTVSVGTVNASVTSGLAQVPVSFFNDEILAGVNLVLTWDSPDVTVDSFSFAGGRLQDILTKGVTYGGNYIIAFCFPWSQEELIGPGTGNLGTLFFSYSTGIDPQLVLIDSITIILGDIQHATTFSDINSSEFSPQFVTGSLNIVAGCCLGDRGNVDNSPDDAADISDLTFLVEYLFGGGPAPVCEDEANLDGLFGVDIADLTYIVEYLFVGGPPPPPCP